MAFSALSDNQKQALKALELAHVTRARAELLQELAESRLVFLALTRTLFSGDPWFIEQSAGVQATLHARRAEDEAFERRRLADSHLWLSNMESLIAAGLKTLNGNSNG